MNKRFAFVGIALVILSVMGIGCYTVLTHPRVQGEEGEAIEHSGRYYREHCTDCHGDYHNYLYGFYYGYYPDYYWSQPRWGHYYAYPWWWDWYWWDDDYYYYEEGDQAPVSSEKAERRMGIAPPYVRPTSGPATPFVLPNPPTDEQTDDVQPPDKPEARKIEKQKEEEKKETKAKRRRK